MAFDWIFGKRSVIPIYGNVYRLTRSYSMASDVVFALQDKITTLSVGGVDPMGHPLQPAVIVDATSQAVLSHAEVTERLRYQLRELKIGNSGLHVRIADTITVESTVQAITPEVLVREVYAVLQGTARPRVRVGSLLGIAVWLLLAPVLGALSLALYGGEPTIILLATSLLITAVIAVSAASSSIRGRFISRTPRPIVSPQRYRTILADRLNVGVLIFTALVSAAATLGAVFLTVYLDEARNSSEPHLIAPTVSTETR